MTSRKKVNQNTSEEVKPQVNKKEQILQVIKKKSKEKFLTTLTFVIFLVELFLILIFILKLLNLRKLLYLF